MAIKLADTLAPMTENFPAAEAKDVEITLTGGIKKRLQKAYEDGDLGGGVEGLVAVETMPSTPEDGDTVLYTGTTGEYIKGHIYKYREYDNFYAYAEDSTYFVYVKNSPPSVGDDFYTVSSEEHKAKNASELNLVEDYSVSEVNGDNIKTSAGDGTYIRNSNADLGSYWEDITLSGIELVYDSSEIPSNPEDDDVIFYLGDNTSTFTKNHFYKYVYSNDIWKDLSLKIIKDVETLPSGSNIEDTFYRVPSFVLNGTTKTINVESDEPIEDVIDSFREAFPTWEYESDDTNVYLRCPENEFWDINDPFYPDMDGQLIDNIYFFIPAGLWDVNLKNGNYQRYNVNDASQTYRKYKKEFAIYEGSSETETTERIAYYKDIVESGPYATHTFQGEGYEPQYIKFTIPYDSTEKVQYGFEISGCVDRSSDKFTGSQFFIGRYYRSLMANFMENNIIIPMGVKINSSNETVDVFIKVANKGTETYEIPANLVMTQVSGTPVDFTFELLDSQPTGIYPSTYVIQAMDATQKFLINNEWMFLKDVLDYFDINTLLKSNELDILARDGTLQMFVNADVETAPEWKCKSGHLYIKKYQNEEANRIHLWTENDSLYLTKGSGLPSVGDKVYTWASGYCEEGTVTAVTSEMLAFTDLGGVTHMAATREQQISSIWVDVTAQDSSSEEALETAEQALAVASAASLQAKEAKEEAVPHFTGTRNEVNSAISQNKIPDGAYVSVTDDIDQDYDTDYSTNEVKLANKWIDGKPIYRKVVSGLNMTLTTTWQDSAIDSSDIDNLIYAKGITTGGAVFTVNASPRALGNGHVGLESALSPSVLAMVILEYTKLSD